MGKDLKGKELGTGLTQRKDGRYQGRYKDRWGNTKTIYNMDLRILRTELSVKIAENETGKSVQGKVTLDAWFIRWIEVYKEKSVREVTKKTYISLYKNHVSPYLGHKKISTIVKSDIQLVIDRAYEKGCQETHQGKIRSMLVAVFNRAIDDDMILKNPAKGVELRSTNSIGYKKEKVLTVEEQELFLEYSRNTFFENMFNVALNTGLRPGELFALQKKDINFEESYITVEKTLNYIKLEGDGKRTFHIGPPKTRQSYRKVPINSVCREYLKRQFEQKEVIDKKYPKKQNNFLFITRKNEPMYSAKYTYEIAKIIKRINFVRPCEKEMAIFTGHALRHTFATRCFEKGIDPKVVQSYLGHASLKMTMDLYTHVTDEKANMDIEKIVPSSLSDVISINT